MAYTEKQIRSKVTPLSTVSSEQVEIKMKSKSKQPTV